MHKEVSSLNDRELINAVEHLRNTEHLATADFLLHLIEVDKRKLYRDKGFSSLFSYLTQGLLYSEPAAHRRLSSARMMDRFDELYPMFLKKEVSLSTISRISRVLNEDNKAELIPAIARKSRAEVDALVAKYQARFQPMPQIKEQIKTIFVPKRSAALAPAGDLFSKHGDNLVCMETSSVVVNAPKPAAVPTIPLEEKFEIRFTVGPAFMAKLKRATALESNKGPQAMKLEAVFEAAIDEYLKKHCPEERLKRREKRSRKIVEGQKRIEERPVNTHLNRSYVSQKIRDEVFRRDGGQCAFVSKDGVRCNCKYQLEIDHILPKAKGGSNEISNLRLLCRAHNQFAAEQHYGTQFIRSFHKRVIPNELCANDFRVIDSTFAA